MKFMELPLKGAYLIELEKIEDDRGFFARFYCKSIIKIISLALFLIVTSEVPTRQMFLFKL